MRPNRSILKSFAIILLLVFAQKMGGGLYLHNWLHSNNFKEAPASTGTIVTGYNCSCIDDFSIPFTADPNPVIEKSSSVQAEFISFYRSLVPPSSPSFNAERGPPCFS